MTDKCHCCGQPLPKKSESKHFEEDGMPPELSRKHTWQERFKAKREGSWV